MSAPKPPGVDTSTKKLPREVEAIRKAISAAMATPDPERPTQTIGHAKAGIYAFYDYDGEPIYVGQTAESFAGRISRHLTGQRSDAVAKYVLDPFEVHSVAMWSIPEIGDKPAKQRKALLNPYEYAVYQMLLEASEFNAVLNEGNIPAADAVELPAPVHVVIIPNDIYPDRSHPDVRIARRAQTISLLAKNISERKVSKGLRRTLLTQTRRLNDLAGRRFDAVGGVIPVLSDDDESEESD